MSYKCSIDVEYFLLQQFDYLPVCMSVFIYLSISIYSNVTPPTFGY